MRVIKIRHIKREIKEEEDISSRLSYLTSTRHTKTYQADVTQVLCMNWQRKLIVKEFNGKWDLKDLKVGR